MILEHVQQAQTINIPIDLQALMQNVYHDAYLEGYTTCGIKGALIGALIMLAIVLLVTLIKSYYDSYKLKIFQAEKFSCKCNKKGGKHKKTSLVHM